MKIQSFSNESLTHRILVTVCMLGLGIFTGFQAGTYLNGTIQASRFDTKESNNLYDFLIRMERLENQIVHTKVVDLKHGNSWKEQSYRNKQYHAEINQLNKALRRLYRLNNCTKSDYNFLVSKLGRLKNQLVYTQQNFMIY